MTTNKLQKASAKDLYEISLKSASAKEKVIYIYEKSDLSDIIGTRKAEELRKEFLKNKIHVKQITNIPELPAFSKNDDFINTCMTFRYIPKEVFDIENEIIVFDDTVAIYNTKPEIRLSIIEDDDFAKNQKQLFSNLWDQGQPPVLGFEYKPNHSFYRNLDFTIQGKHVIVYPDKDAVESYKGFNYESLNKYIEKIVEENQDYFNDADYLIIFIWNYEGQKMMDVWKLNSNHVDDRSGPLGAIKVFKEGKECDDLGVASGNTLLVLGYEEKLRRQSADLKSYFQGPPPALPLEILTQENFFEAMDKCWENKE